MPSTPRLREAVLASREQLQLSRHKLQQQHDRSSHGIHLCSLWSQRLEEVSLRVFDDAILMKEDELPHVAWRNHLTLVAHGGFGRRDTAPFSDLDVMLLYSPEIKLHVATLAGQLLQNLSDLGEDIGFSARMPVDACQLASQDPMIYSSLVEARRLAGDERLFERFHERFQRSMRRRSKRLIRAVEDARKTERSRYGDTVNLLQPNVKRSPGGLRDLHLLRWVGFARYGSPDMEVLRRQGRLSALDYRRLREAWEFLLRLRNELHFHAGRSQDMLNRAEQVRIAEKFEYTGTPAVLPVERFMQQYFHHSSNIRDIVSHFVASAKQGPWWPNLAAPLVSHYMDRDFLVGPRQIQVRARCLNRVRGDLHQVLRLMDLASRFDKRIDHSTWEAIRSTMMERDSIELTPETAHQFLSLMSQVPHLGELLRRLHELRVLEKIIPPFAHARCLLQFNEYHKYTVDEHSIRAVEAATHFQDDPGYLGASYRKIRNKQTLHLALLIHDLGKGFDEDHSEVGRRLAVEVGARLGLPEDDRQSLEFLVHQHLYLAHLAFRRDTSDESAIVRAAVDIGSPRLLRMLFVMTCADYAAVGPGVLNSWKIELLSDIVQRIRTHLTVEEPSERQAQERQQLRDGIAQRFQNDPAASWFSQQIDLLPTNYLRMTQVESVVEDLKHLHRLEGQSVEAWGRFDRQRRVSEYHVTAREGITDGIFHKLTGALTAKRLQILSAELMALDGDRFFDRFVVEDPDFGDEPHPSRFAEVEEALRQSLAAAKEVRPEFRQTWKELTPVLPLDLSRFPANIRTDSSTSERYTIIEVFAHDRPGLLYQIARTLHECGLSVAHAKIGTYIDQVVDVFYVTDRQGRKISQPAELHRIRDALMAAASHPATRAPDNDSLARRT